MKIAIIGSGISGLTAAHLLKDKHEVDVFEKADRIGGHTATKQISLGGRDYSIDTGFIVYNDWTYPNFIRLMDELGVESQPTTMGFSVTAHEGGYEYSGEDLSTLFAQKKNLLSIKHWGMIRDIVRFNKQALQDLDDDKVSPELTLGEYLKSNGYGQQFIDYYLVPMGCAIWSSSTDMMLKFPLLFFVRFFKNHGLLSVTNRPQWRVLKGGSNSYLKPITKALKGRIHTNASITGVKRLDGKVSLSFSGGEVKVFDQLIMACHSDQALALLDDVSQCEAEVLNKMQYKSNDVVLHTDESLLPKNKKTWSSWNYLLDSTQQDSATLTYHMNILQGISSDENFCVTLNATQLIDPSKILGQYTYSHPVFTMDAIEAQSQWSSINGINNTWFCGAYWANGFHEDGCSSGVRVAKALGSDW